MSVPLLARSLEHAAKNRLLMLPTDVSMWLKVPERVKFRLCVLTYRCLNGTTPHYLAETIHPVTSRCTRQRLRSADTSTLLVPPTRRTTLGDRSFPAAAARAWNTLPQQVQDAPSLPVFRRELKTVLFRRPFRLTDNMFRAVYQRRTVTCLATNTD